MPTAGLIEKDLEICRISTGQLLCSCAQVNIEQNVIQFLVLLYIMDRETETDRQTTETEVALIKVNARNTDKNHIQSKKRVRMSVNIPLQVVSQVPNKASTHEKN